MAKRFELGRFAGTSCIGLGVLTAKGTRSAP